MASDQTVDCQDRKEQEINDMEECYIIGIGASAGGMEAIHSLFDHTPEDGAAYVIVQHLSPDHKSFMAELLEKHSKLVICEAEHNMRVRPNQVYLMPKGKNMTISNRRLQLSDMDSRQRNTAIDIFLDSLAADIGNRSIAVILSGTGSDGSKGIAAVKKNGGYVIVQDPESSKFDGMPKSAIQTGNVDVVLAPERIPDEVIAYLKRDLLEHSFTEPITEADEEALKEIIQIIQEHTPLDFSDYKRPTIIRRIIIRMTYKQVKSLKGYIELLHAEPEEINILAHEFLISVTGFFRDPEAFQIISEKVIPEIIKGKLQVDTLKLWVVGCATGEEAYSLAILISERLTELKKNLEVKIFASDIDKVALQHASNGVYPESIAKDVSGERLGKFFVPQGHQYKVRDNIRKMIIFADHDIVKQPPYGKIDLISCRNLLIYLNPLLQQKILASLHFCLNVGGYLFLGPSESLGNLRESFKDIDKKWKIFKSAETLHGFREMTYSVPGLEKNWDKLPAGPSSSREKRRNGLTDFILQTLLEETGYEAGICVDDQFQILQTFGNFEKFLLPKIFNYNLIEMLPEMLAIATSTSLHKAQTDGRSVLVENVGFRRDESDQVVDVFVKPFLSEHSALKGLKMVMYKNSDKQSNTEVPAEAFNKDLYTTRYVEDLVYQLSDTKEKLSEAYEALELSSDNISSYNEELISSNEELQSTNEELQSVNEELQTVNHEYQLKIKELAELNDDLNNYFRSSNTGQLYVDKELIVRKFSPTATNLINLQESDVGRPLSDISTKIKDAALESDIKEVIATAVCKEKEIQTLDSRWYQMILMPYTKQNEKEYDGVIIAFHDITDLKKTQKKLSRINADHDTFIYSVSHDLSAPLSNMEIMIHFLKESINPDNAEEVELFDYIKKSIIKLREIISELSDINKITNEALGAENLHMPSLFEDVKMSIKEVLKTSRATIHEDFQEPIILFAKKNMRSILINLLTNAAKYRSPHRDPVIHVRTERSDDFIVLSVTDNGLGIAPSKVEDVFAQFKRAHNHVDGSGVGLYLVKKMVNNADGDIEVESEEGVGSTFKVYFKCPE